MPEYSNNTALLKQTTHVVFIGINCVRYKSRSGSDVRRSHKFLYSRLCYCLYNTGVKAIISLYSDRKSSRNQSSLVSIVNNGLTSQLAANLANFLTTYNLDGVAVDWESGESQEQMTAVMDAIGPAVHAFQVIK